jgi:hypothetical protein
VQADSQQTPSAQNPDTQSPPVLHFEPSGNFPQPPSAEQRAGGVHWVSFVHVIWQAPPLQVQGEQSTVVPSMHCPWPSHAEAGRMVRPSLQPAARQMVPAW